ncbi:MAG: GntR family transcriptional regulator [Hyphomicrobiaceae bacterium]
MASKFITPERETAASWASGSPSLTDSAYTLLEERIVTLKMQPGAQVSEQVLCQESGLGRTPVREAIQRLAREGLVVVQPRKGIRVTESDPRQQMLVLEVRRELERLLSRMAAKRASLEQRSALLQIAIGMETASQTNDDLAFMRLDREMNVLIMEAAHNDYAAGAMRLINGHSRRFWYQHYKTAADLPRCAMLHAAQARTIAEGNPTAAASALDALIDYTEEFTRAIDPPDPDAVPSIT